MRGRRSTGLVGPLVLSSVCLVSAAAWAQAPGNPPRDVAGAEALFAEGKRLMDGGHTVAACPKFEESLRLDPGVGALLNLAACREKEGRIATAWAHYRDAEAQLQQSADDRRAAFAKERATALEPRLPMVIVTVESPPDGVMVSRDGITLSAASLGTRLPVDPGPHKLIASAPGRLPREREFVAREREVAQIRIAALDLAPEEPPPLAPFAPPSTPPGEASGSSTQKTLSFVIGGAGIVTLVAGFVFVGATAAQKSAADDNCPTVTTCSAAGFDAIATAKDLALAADFTIIGGAVLTGAGVVLYVTAPAGKPVEPGPSLAARMWIAPSFSPNDVGVRASGSF